MLYKFIKLIRILMAQHIRILVYPALLENKHEENGEPPSFILNCD